jgi:hypothetical protein
VTADLFSGDWRGARTREAERFAGRLENLCMRGTRAFARARLPQDVW